MPSTQRRSWPAEVIQDPSHIPASFHRAQIDPTWSEWMAILESLPAGFSVKWIQGVARLRLYCDSRRAGLGRYGSMQGSWWYRAAAEAVSFAPVR